MPLFFINNGTNSLKKNIPWFPSVMGIVYLQHLTEVLIFPSAVILNITMWLDNQEFVWSDRINPNGKQKINLVSNDIHLRYVYKGHIWGANCLPHFQLSSTHSFCGLTGFLYLDICCLLSTFHKNEISHKTSKPIF